MDPQFYDPATKQATSSWLCKEECHPAKACPNLQVTRLMLVCLFDACRIVHWEFVEHGLGIAAAVCLGIMRNLQRSLHRRHPNIWMSGRWYLQHDGAPTHRTNLVMNYLCQNHTQILPHPPIPWMLLWPTTGCSTGSRNTSEGEDLPMSMTCAVRSMPSSTPSPQLSSSMP